MRSHRLDYVLFHTVFSAVYDIRLVVIDQTILNLRLRDYASQKSDQTLVDIGVMIMICSYIFQTTSSSKIDNVSISTVLCGMTLRSFDGTHATHSPASCLDRLS